MQFDIRMEVATMYKTGLVHNSKQEQLVASAVASQQILDANVTLRSVSDWSADTSASPTAACAMLQSPAR